MSRVVEGFYVRFFWDWLAFISGAFRWKVFAVFADDVGDTSSLSSHAALLTPWLNTEGDDISGSYVKYKDHQEVVAALEAKCAALAAENELARKAVQAFCDVVGDNTEVIAEEVGRDGVLVILGAMKATGNISATDAFLAEIRAEARNEGINYTASRLAAAFNHGFINKSLREVFDVTRMILSAKEELANEPHPIDGLSGEYAEKSLEEWAEQIRKGGKQ